MLLPDGWISVGEVYGRQLAIKHGERPRLVAMRSNPYGGPFMNFRTEARLRLKAAARLAGAEAALCYWPPRESPRFIPAADWPPAV